MVKTALVTTGMVVAMGGAFAAGYFVSNYNHLKNTPESVISKMETAKAEAKTEQILANKSKKEADDAIEALRRTKAQYQAEIKPELEAKIRKELNSYISQADEKYEKAKKEHELAALKLELAREKGKDSTVAADIYKMMVGGV